jgi:hypothetical protein
MAKLKELKAWIMANKGWAIGVVVVLVLLFWVA